MLVVDLELDCIGLTCPMPLLKAKQAIARLEPGQVLQVKATDSGSVRDFSVWAELSGHQLINSVEEAGIYIHTVQKASG